MNNVWLCSARLQESYMLPAGKAGRLLLFCSAKLCGEILRKLRFNCPGWFQAHDKIQEPRELQWTRLGLSRASNSTATSQLRPWLRAFFSSLSHNRGSMEYRRVGKLANGDSKDGSRRTRIALSVHSRKRYRAPFERLIEYWYLIEQTYFYPQFPIMIDASKCNPTRSSMRRATSSRRRHPAPLGNGRLPLHSVLPIQNKIR